MGQSRLCRLIAVVAWLSLLAIALPAMPAGAATPSPSASAPSGGGNVTGHWAIAGTSGIDLVQRGGTVSGSSAAGVAVSGTVDGLRVTFRWWRGTSYATTKAADRGTGVMQLSADGERLQIAAKADDAGPGPFPTQMEAVRVHDIMTSPAPSYGPLYAYWSYYTDDPVKVYWASRAYLDYIVQSWILCMQTGYWPSPAVAWIKVEDTYAKSGVILIGGWLPNGGGPTLLNPAFARP
jgi:hypothetical protein